MRYFPSFPGFGRRPASLAGTLLACAVGAFGASAGPVPPAARPAGPPTLAILDPIDLSDGSGQPRYGDRIRAGVRDAGRFQALPRAEMERKLNEFNWHPAKPCHEFQCGFDAGNILMSEYVWFGTVTAMDGLYAYTFNILHVPTGQVVHSEAGEVPRKPGDGGDAPLQARMASYLSGLDPSRFDLSRKARHGLMAVVDPGSESVQSRVLAERIGTHIYASRNYDLMSRTELQELVAAMNIPTDAGTTDSAAIALGARLNVAYLVRSELERGSRGQKLELALFDIAAQRRIRDWTSKPESGYDDILRLEHRFFTTLAGPPGELASRGAPGAKAGGTRSWWTRGALSVAGVAAAAGLTALALTLHQDANAAYLKAESATSMESAKGWQRTTSHRDVATVASGVGAGLCLAAAVTVWTF